ncbi:MAG: pantetheine-phosphate adenylyltransferase [Nitriliruptorales bacterium]
MSTSAVCPGSFDPVTYGHLDIIERAASRFEQVVVAVLQNTAKQALFSLEDRVRLIEETTSHLDNVAVDTFEGLLVDFAQARGTRVIVKGLRAVSDFEYELQMAQMNRRLGDVETLFMPTAPEWSYLSSSLVKEVASLGGSIEGVVPPQVAAALKERYPEA